jgi:hypothetical protein
VQYTPEFDSQIWVYDEIPDELKVEMEQVCTESNTVDAEAINAIIAKYNVPSAGPKKIKRKIDNKLTPKTSCSTKLKIK